MNMRNINAYGRHMYMSLGLVFSLILLNGCSKSIPSSGIVFIQCKTEIECIRKMREICDPHEGHIISLDLDEKTEIQCSTR